MSPKDNHHEEDYGFSDRKKHRKERKRLSQKDRSKFKKTDQKQLKNQTATAKNLPSNLLRGRILAITPEGIHVDANGTIFNCSLKGSLKKETGQIKNLIAVGDFVHFESESDQTGVIASIGERYSILSRESPLARMKQQLIAVNIDQVIITASVLMPPLKSHLIDRYIIAAEKGNMQPVIVINKIDYLHNPPKHISSDEVEREIKFYQELLKIYRDLKIPVFPISTLSGEGIEELKKAMQGKSSVFSGQSGTGKSSLINAVTGQELEIGDVVHKTKKGSHTTSSAQLIPIEGGGFCIDTPGIKSFGVWDLKKEEIQRYFSEIAHYADQCRYLDCTHLKEPHCGVKKALEENKISPLRFESYCALMTSLMKEHRLR
jgi:ribosome biogenesis GTPase